MKVEKIKVEPYSLGQLMVGMREGRIRVPKFQREFVWERRRIQELLDSMYREYPIGTIFLWDAPTQYNHFLRTVDYLQQPTLDKNRNYTLILDGQQRLTSLYVTVFGLQIEGEDYRKIVVDLDPKDSEKVFVYKEPDNKRWVSVKDMLDDQNFFPIYNNLPTDKHKENFVRYSSLLKNYPFSVVLVRDMDLESAIEIFERINRAGRPLSRYDLITASILDDDFDLREKTENDIIKPFVIKGFGEIEEASIPQALALNIKENTESSVQMDLRKDDVKQAWSATAASFCNAIDYVRNNLGVNKLDYLPYDAMLPVLSHYFFKANVITVNAQHKEQLDQWFWRVAFSERYSGNSQTRMTEDAKWIRELIVSGIKYDIPIITDVATLADISMTYTNSAIRNGVLCLLNLLTPLHFRNGTKVNLMDDYFNKFNLAERHHIFPVAFLKKQGLKSSDVHKLPNFSFIPEDLGKWIGNRPPSEYMKDIKDELGEDKFEHIMYTHLIPVDENSGIWNNNYERFLIKRAELILQEIRRRCDIAESISLETRNPLLDAVEMSFRDIIHDVLMTNFGMSYWDVRIPKNVASKVEERINSHITKKPSETKNSYNDPRKKLDFCDILDYKLVIEYNWQWFSNVFRSKSELNRNIDYLNTYRNLVKHTRNIDQTTELHAKASIIWLAEAMKMDLSKFSL